MSPSIQIKKHHSIKELTFAFQTEKDASIVRHIQIVLLIKEGRSTREVTGITKFSADTIYRVCKRYNENRIEGLGDLRRYNQGKESTLTHEEKMDIKKNLRTVLPTMVFGLDLSSQDG